MKHLFTRILYGIHFRFRLRNPSHVCTTGSFNQIFSRICMQKAAGFVFLEMFQCRIWYPSTHVIDTTLSQDLLSFLGPRGPGWVSEDSPLSPNTLTMLLTAWQLSADWIELQVQNWNILERLLHPSSNPLPS